MQLNAAQTIILDYFGNGVVERTGDYKAPHAYRGTPARPHFERKPKMVFSTATDTMVPVRRPFKGHRP